MGYFSINTDDETKKNIIQNIKNNLKLYENKIDSNDYSYLLDTFILSDLEKLIKLDKDALDNLKKYDS